MGRPYGTGENPRAIVEKIAAAVLRAVKMPDVAEKFKATGATPVGDLPEHFARYLREVVSTGRRNTLAKLLCWRLEVQRFPSAM